MFIYMYTPETMAEPLECKRERERERKQQQLFNICAFAFQIKICSCCFVLTHAGTHSHTQFVCSLFKREIKKKAHIIHECLWKFIRFSFLMLTPPFRPFSCLLLASAYTDDDKEYKTLFLCTPRQKETYQVNRHHILMVHHHRQRHQQQLQNCQ